MEFGSDTVNGTDLRSELIEDVVVESVHAFAQRAEVKLVLIRHLSTTGSVYEHPYDDHRCEQNKMTMRIDSIATTLVALCDTTTPECWAAACKVAL